MPGTAKKIARDLKRELLRDPQAVMFFSQGYRYAGDRIVGVSYTVSARRQVPQGDATQ
jgi:hypothetical protein